MKWLYQLADAANALLLTLTGIAATLMMIGGLYALNDIYYTNRTAFVSYDLLQYRPTAQSSERKDVRTFTELREINQDTVGWLELFDTHINYPVVQGNDNFEYLNKDIFGYSTLSGSIYLAAENSSGFDDWYNIVYGHHMDNGAMFSDIEKFLDAEYFASHSDGILQTETGDYKIKTIACIRTNAYEDIVYQVQDSAEIQYPVLQEYIRKHSEYPADLPEAVGDGQILGLSTCSDAVTDGRIVLFAVVRPWDTDADGDAESYMEQITEETGLLPLLNAKGHSVSNSKWSVLNLMCVICAFLTLLPLWALRGKFGQFSYARNYIREREETSASDQDDSTAETKQQIVRDLKAFIRKGRTGLLLELVILLLSVIVFLLTEDMRGRMGILDSWTGWMILIAAVALTVDIICLRYRGKRPEHTQDSEDSDQDNPR